MQDVHVKLNPGLSWKNSIQQEENSFRLQIVFKITGKTSMLGA
jgi:hypothetical protein